MDIAALLGPVPGDNPGGSDARYEPEYARMLEEVDKLTSISHSQECRWDVVEEEAERILRDKAKDFQAASYLGYALYRLHGLEGMADGAQILAGLVERFWETGFPVLRRVRGRVNALSWWRERMELALDGLVADSEARYDPELLARLVSALQDLDKGLAEHLPDQPSLRNLLDRAQRLVPQKPASSTQATAEEANEGMAAPKEEAQSEQSSGQPDEQADGQAGKQAGAQAAGEETATHAPLAADRKAAPQNVAMPKAQASQTASVQALETPPPPGDNAAENRRNFLRYAGEFALAEKSASLLSPLAWQATFLARLGQVERLPPAEAGRTALPSPPESERQAIEGLVQKGMAREALTAADDLWGAHLFWLDGPRIITWALKTLGSSAHVVTALETLLFVRRLEGIELLSFGDGTPFASEATCAFLSSLAGEGGGEDTQAARPKDTAGKGTEDILARARALFAENRQAEALDILDGAQACARDKKAFLSLRLEQVRLLLRLEKIDAALALAEDLLARARELRADIWASDTMLDILRLVIQCLGQGQAASAGKRIGELYAEMALIRPSSVL